MAILFDSACIDVFVFLITALIGFITYYKWATKYWERRNMPCLDHHFPFGSMQNPVWNPVSVAEQTIRQYEECKAKGQKHIGMYILSMPFYMPVDPEYIKNIMTKDFSHFVDRGVYFNEKSDPLSAHLFSIEGTVWKNLRMKLTPTFTSGKMKMMFQTLVECVDQLRNYVDTIGNEPINIKEALGCYTTDVIGSCAFGIQCNSFEDPNSEFRRHLQRAFVATKYENLKGFLGFAFPELCRCFGMYITPKEVTKFVMGVVKDTVEYREKNNVERKDFMQLLMQLKNDKVTEGVENQHDGKRLTIEELAAQAFIFLLAGFETSSTTMTFCLFELALNPEIQQRVRDEINTVLEKHGGKITYESVIEMKYLGQVIDETLRKYPPLPTLNRKCVETYKVPGTNVTVEKGVSVIIPAFGLQRDEKYFPNPEKFDPERFSEENKHKIVPYTYLPFGEGPRICIGLRFGVMQTKVGLATLLKNFAFSVNDKTQMPLKFDPANFILSTLGDIWLDVKKIQH